MTNWKEVHASVKPDELDATSSSFVIYERRNIRQETVRDPMSDTDIIQWVYEERQMDKDEYAQLSSPTTQLIMQNLSDIEADILDIVV